MYKERNDDMKTNYLDDFVCDITCEEYYNEESDELD